MSLASDVMHGITLSQNVTLSHLLLGRVRRGCQFRRKILVQYHHFFFAYKFKDFLAKSFFYVFCTKYEDFTYPI